jgi:hypothetical protein
VAITASGVSGSRYIGSCRQRSFGTGPAPTLHRVNSALRATRLKAAPAFKQVNFCKRVLRRDQFLVTHHALTVLFAFVINMIEGVFFHDQDQKTTRESQKAA